MDSYFQNVLKFALNDAEVSCGDGGKKDDRDWKIEVNQKTYNSSILTYLICLLPTVCLVRKK